MLGSKPARRALVRVRQIRIADAAAIAVNTGRIERGVGHAELEILEQTGLLPIHTVLDIVVATHCRRNVGLAPQFKSWRCWDWVAGVSAVMYSRLA